MSHPYRGLPGHQYWRRGVETLDWIDVDPVANASFRLSPEMRVATAGSCFAQHIARALTAEGFSYMRAENPPAGQEGNPLYTDFSAAYGNIYTVEQLLQLMHRAYGLFNPETTYWQNAKGRFIDPFRPAVREDGFETHDELLHLQKSHLKAVRRVFEECDVFIFTLGLTEGWRAKADGAFVPVVPGAVGCSSAADLYEFHNARVPEMTRSLSAFLADLRLVNPDVRVILTVSPVSLIATYEQRHVVVSNTYSKSALRVVAEEAVGDHDFVSYFPSFEIINSHPSKARFFESDLRSVRADGVAHVMRIFAKHHLDRSGGAQRAAAIDAEPAPSRELEEQAAREYESVAGVLCDEERYAS